jgi:hypothetical protein
MEGFIGLRALSCVRLAGGPAVSGERYRRRMLASEFLAAFAAEIGTAPPNRHDTDVLLELAGIAAHASERLAAPLACWMGGASGLAADELLAAARRIAPAPDDS